jgi:hypothetical protein
MVQMAEGWKLKSGAELSAWRRAWLYFNRSLRWQCPVCGLFPLFCPVSQVHSLNDWFATLPGCPHCQYVYDREPGCFLLAFWMFDYGAAALFRKTCPAVIVNDDAIGILPLRVIVPITDWKEHLAFRNPVGAARPLFAAI